MLSQQLVTVSLNRMYFKRYFSLKDSFIASKQKTLDNKVGSNFFDEAVSLIYKIIKNYG